MSATAQKITWLDTFPSWLFAACVRYSDNHDAIVEKINKRIPGISDNTEEIPDDRVAWHNARAIERAMSTAMKMQLMPLKQERLLADFLY